MFMQIPITKTIWAIRNQSSREVGYRDSVIYMPVRGYLPSRKLGRLCVCCLYRMYTLN